MKRKDSKRRWRPGLVLALCLALGALVLSGCGGSSGASGSSTAASTTASAAGGKGGPGTMNISAKAKACLKEKGVQLPEGKGGEGEPPAGGSGGEGSEEMTKGFKECGVEMPEAKGGPGSEGGAPNMNSTAFKTQVKEYVACVRENGYELAEPNFSGEGPVFVQEESESAAFETASAQCQSLLGGPGVSGQGA